MLMRLGRSVGISLAGSVFFICSTGDKKPRVLWERGRPYLPSKAASPATALVFLFFPLVPEAIRHDMSRFCALALLEAPPSP